MNSMNEARDVGLQSPPWQSSKNRLAAPAQFSDTQLLALLIGHGEPGTRAEQIAEHLLATCGGPAGLFYADARAQTVIRSQLGGRRLLQLLAAREFATRALEQRLTDRDAFSSPDAVKQYLQIRLARENQEQFAVLFLDAQNRLLTCEVMFRGTVTQTAVYPREIVVRALEQNAAAVVLAHNHPSGTVQPSRADESLTQTIKAALALVDVRVLDHVIVAPGTALSFAERGLL